ncbi:MAG: ABC-F family ATP-binding cassette domain-containing protein [Clostridiales bacterium]|nr:ABC-F family ATP-binding cassette domain-containing protein [Candidatus Crickella merdequi]
MIHVEELSYGFPAKELFDEVSFDIEEGRHCALIGSNGTGKTTLVDILMHKDDYLYDGTITLADNCRIGYASQFTIRDKVQDCTVAEFLAERFHEVQQQIVDVCEEMATAEDLEEVYERYQMLLDLNEAMDGDNYESRIQKELFIAGMTDIADVKLASISGGEYKVLQIMKEMLFAPNILVLDEPDAFLDFANLSNLCRLINAYEGTLLAVTHNRYLLNHCFDTILHLEDKDIQQFDGNYTEYRCAQYREKLKIKEQSMLEEEEIEHQQALVDSLRKRATEMVNPVIGRTVNAKQTYLNRLRDRHIKAPFIEFREPRIRFPEIVKADDSEAVQPAEPKAVLSIKNYQIEYDRNVLDAVDFDLLEGETVAIVGANGTGKTTLIRDIVNNNHPSIHINPDTEYACFSQILEENLDENKTVFDVMYDEGFYNETLIRNYLNEYCLGELDLKQPVCHLSTGEQNLLQVAIIANSGAELLIMDEPTSHLDVFAQLALEKAIDAYEGTVLMISHDFYLVANCADYVLLIEDNSIRRMRNRTFRKMVYDKYFEQKYLELDRKRQEVETRISEAYRAENLKAAEKYCDQLEELSK